MNNLADQIKEIVLNALYLEPGSFNRVEPGQLTSVGGRVFICQFSHFTRNFPRWLAAVASNCPESEVRKFIAGNLYEEEIGPAGQGSHYDLLLRQGEAMGLTREAIETTTPLSTTALAISALENICRNPSWLEGLAATTGLECINHPVVRAESGVIIINDVRAWKHLGLSDQQLRSRTIHTEEDEKHVENGLRILAAHAATEEAQEKVVNSAREALLAFRLLMEGIGKAAFGNLR
ncbi:MAG TPA: iron-containing redox enzyme family protein [Candidatus Binatia bacterium]